MTTFMVKSLYLELLEGRERGDLGKSLEDEGTKIISLFFKKKNSTQFVMHYI